MKKKRFNKRQCTKMITLNHSFLFPVISRLLYCLLPVACCLLLSSCGGGGESSAVSGNPAPEYGSLYISSYPSATKILLDGNDTGSVTPALVKDVSTGQHTLTLTKPDHEDWSKTVTVPANQQVTIPEEDAVLTPKEGGDSSPPPLP